MKKIIFVFVSLLLLGAVLRHAMELDSGYVLIVLGNVSIEATFWMSLFLVLGVLCGFWLILYFLSRSTRVFAHLSQSSGRRAQALSTRGMLQFLDGNWSLSKKLLLRSVGRSDAPLINYLAAARCAFELGDRNEAIELLHKAEKSSANSELAVALSQARMQLLGERYEQCLATLSRAKLVAPDHPVVLELLASAYQRLEDWQGLQRLLPDLKRHKILSDESYLSLETLTYMSLLKLEHKVFDLDSDRLVELNDIWQAMPARLRRNSEMLLSYCHKLMPFDGEAVESELRRALNKDWQDPLVALYGCTQGMDVHRQLLTAEGWLKERPANATLLLALGRIAMRNELWGQAKTYFERSIGLHTSPEAYAELARLLAHLGQHKESTEYYQQGLLLSTQGLPELPMPKR